MIDITKHFLVLGLDSTATAAQVKEARHWYTKAFHPDRYPKDSTDQLKAEEKQKQINLAYEQITAWWKSGGHAEGSKPKASAKAAKSRSFHEDADEYFEYLAQSDRSTLTLRNVFSDLAGFFDWLESHGVQGKLDNSAKNLVSKYVKNYLERQYKPVTIARHLYSIRGFLTFCKLESDFILELTAQYKAASRSRPKSLTESQVTKLLAITKKHAKKQNRLLIDFLLQTGLTAGELCDLTWREVSVTTPPGSKKPQIILEVSGRSGFREIPLSAGAVHSLTELGVYEILATGGSGLDAPIFEAGGKYWTPKMIHYAVTECGTAAAVDVTPSALRNTFAFRLVASGVPRHQLAHYIGISEASAGVYYPTKEVRLKDLVDISKKV